MANHYDLINEKTSLNYGLLDIPISHEPSDEKLRQEVINHTLFGNIEGKTLRIKKMKSDEVAELRKDFLAKQAVI